MYQRGVSRTPTPKPSQRIAKLLARAGIASRREIERMIAERRIAIDGVPLDTPATLVTSLHGVTVDGNPVEAPSPARLFVFHKPSGVLVTERDPKGRPTIYDRLPADLPRVVPVGRLDLATEGLLLLTTDGELKRQLELPATGVERAYRARAYGTVTQEQLEDLIEGVTIDGVRYGPIDANLERRTGANVWIELILTEGKNREVRRVLEYLGLQVSRLIRVRYGPFVLGDLPVGAVGEVRQHDLIAFRQSLSGKRRGNEELIEVAASSAPAPRRAEKPAEGPRKADRPGTPRRIDRSKPAPPSSRERRPGSTARPAATSANRTTTRKRPDRSDTLSGNDRQRRDDQRRTTDEQTPKPSRPKRGAGWAKAKPRPRPPGRPRGGPRGK
jgi:23S rRNA pseudouridine2605 synthase